MLQSAKKRAEPVREIRAASVSPSESSPKSQTSSGFGKLKMTQRWSLDKPFILVKSFVQGAPRFKRALPYDISAIVGVGALDDPRFKRALPNDISVIVGRWLAAAVYFGQTVCFAGEHSSPLRFWVVVRALTVKFCLNYLFTDSYLLANADASVPTVLCVSSILNREINNNRLF